MKVQRYLPPTAAPLTWQDLFSGARGLLQAGRARRRLESQLKSHFGVKHVFLLTSGKAALTIILKALKAGSSRRQVVIPAYTCFSVPSAVLKAGLDVALSDVDPQMLDFDSDSLNNIVCRDTLAIVAPHLLGQPADIRSIRSIAEAVGAYVVEDAAQAMNSQYEGKWLGTQGDVGFFSLGRGKNLSAGSGGVIVTNSDSLAQAISLEYQQQPVESLPAALVNLATVAVTKLLIHPNIYWLPAGLPFLGLGETKFSTDFPVRRLDGVRAGLLLSWENRLEDSNRTRVEQRSRMLARLPEIDRGLCLSDEETVCHLRMPLLMATAQRKAAFCALSKPLGVSALYPSPVSLIPELELRFRTRRFPGAEALASRLVTLPLHRYVSDKDIEEIATAVRRLLPMTSGQKPASTTMYRVSVPEALPGKEPIQ